MMRRKMTESQPWWRIVSASSLDRCLNGGDSFITNERLADKDIYIYDG